MILKLDDWVFNIQMVRTMEYSRNEADDHCTCGYCRNYYAAMDSHLPGLRQLLAQFGVDAEAPDTLYPYDLPGDRMLYEGEYLVFGRIVHAGSNPLQGCAEAGYLLQPISASSHDPLNPCFLLSLEAAQLPWLLDEPLAEVISAANDADFLQEMTDRLLQTQPDNKMPT